MGSADIATIVADWGYGEGLRRAVELMERHRRLRPRRLANAQLSGLNTVVQMASSIGEIDEFAVHQGSRAGRADRPEVKAFWDDLRVALESVEIAAKQATTELAAASGTHDQLALHLAREFTLHLISHAYFIAER
jgi:hypothetical protein